MLSLIERKCDFIGRVATPSGIRRDAAHVDAVRELVCTPLTTTVADENVVPPATPRRRF
jgi:hypothetical protein